MSITYKLNKERNGVEIKFTEKPSEKVRAKMKELGFRWSQHQGVWYAKQTEETIAYAKQLAEEEGEQISLSVADDSAEESVDDIEAIVQKYRESLIAKTQNVESYQPKSEPKKAEPKKAEPKKAEPKKAEKKAEPKKADAPGPTEPKDNIVVFPTKGRPSVRTAITSGSATYKDCEKKLLASKKDFCDSENMGIIEALLKRCEIDGNFRNNVMRTDRTYKGAFDYIIFMAQNGYAYTYGKTTFLDTELSLAFAIDYFNGADTPDELITKISKES